MILGVDVDGVVADLHTGWLKLYNLQYGDCLESSQITEWDIHKFVKPECGKEIYSFLRSKEIYPLTPPIEGSQQAIKELRKLGHRVIFTTTCVKQMTDHKWEWLERHGFLETGPHNQPDLAILADKTLLAADLLVDDRVDNLIDWQKKGKPGILFKAPWNADYREQGLTPYAYTNDWEQIVQRVEGMLYPPREKGSMRSDSQRWLVVRRGNID